MSYDVVILDRCKHCNREEVFWEGNYTYNVSKMLHNVGIRFNDLPRPLYVSEFTNTLEKALDKLKSDPKKYQAMNPSTGWGSYDSMVYNFLRPMLEACKCFPTATIEVS